MSGSILPTFRCTKPQTPVHMYLVKAMVQLGTPVWMLGHKGVQATASSKNGEQLRGSGHAMAMGRLLPQRRSQRVESGERAMPCSPMQIWAVIWETVVSSSA